MSDESEPSTAGRGLTRAEKQAFINDSIALESKARDPQVVRRRKLYAESAANVLSALAERGFDVQSVGELRHRKTRYPAAVPVLLEWLEKVTYLPLVEDIIRTLSVSFAKENALPVFLRLFRNPPSVEDSMRSSTAKPPEEHIRWVIGNGLGIMSGPAIADDLIELALATKYGEARSSIVANLPKTKDPRVPNVLQRLLADSSVSAEAVEALGKMKCAEAYEQIASLLDHSDENIRSQAKRALKRIENQ